MTLIKFPIAKNYVESWGLNEAVREIIQNAIDQEVQSDGANTFSIHHDPLENILHISSKESKLSRNTLLFGTTTKKDDNRTIGKFGEGYKLALLVLTRLNKDVEVFNYSLRERWTTKFVKSRTFEAEVLGINIEKFIWTTPPNNDLTFVIKDVSEKDYIGIAERVLQLQSYETIKLSNGEALLDDRHKRMIFVNGLFVCEMKDENMQYGYNLNSSIISLDRDRSVVDGFDLFWETSAMWSKSSSRHLIVDMANSGASDIKFIKNTSYGSTDEAADLMYDDFETKHNGAIPVSSQEEVDSYTRKGLNPRTVIVGETANFLIRSSSKFVEPVNEVSPPKKWAKPHEVIDYFIFKHGDKFSEEQLKDAMEIASFAKLRWTLKKKRK